MFTSGKRTNGRYIRRPEFVEKDLGSGRFPIAVTTARKRGMHPGVVRLIDSGIAEFYGVPMEVHEDRPKQTLAERRRDYF